MQRQDRLAEKAWPAHGENCGTLFDRPVKWLSTAVNYEERRIKTIRVSLDWFQSANRLLST